VPEPRHEKRVLSHAAAPQLSFLFRVYIGLTSDAIACRSSRSTRFKTRPTTSESMDALLRMNRAAGDSEGGFHHDLGEGRMSVAAASEVFGAGVEIHRNRRF
jgi:hypothetical protein